MKAKTSIRQGRERSSLTAHSRGQGWDCVSQMQMYRHRPDVLASALETMGITENGDELPEAEEENERN